MKFQFINDHKGQWPVRTLCRVLGVSPAGYYACTVTPRSRDGMIEALRVLVACRKTAVTARVITHPLAAQADR